MWTIAGGLIKLAAVNLVTLTVSADDKDCLSVISMVVAAVAAMIASAIQFGSILLYSEKGKEKSEQIPSSKQIMITAEIGVIN